MITPAERIVLKLNETLFASTLTAKGYNAIQLNHIPSGENKTLVAINSFGKMVWRLSDPIIKLNGTETITATETIEILAGYDESALAGFTTGTAHGILKQAEDILTVSLDTTKYNIKAFEYYIAGKRYISLEQLNVPVNFAPGENARVLMVNKDGIFALPANTFPSPDDLVDALEIGAIRTTNGTNIDSIGVSSFFINEIFRNLYIWSKFAKRTNYLTNAAKVTENATPRKLDVASGKILDSNLNLKTLTTQTQIAVSEVYHISSVYSIRPVTLSYSVNVTQWDNGTNLATLGSNKFTSHSLLRSSRTGAFYLVIGHHERNTQAEAETDVYERGLFTEGSDVDPIAQIIVSQASASIVKIIDIRNM